jgi:small subunit ribosomal protein S18
MAQFRKPSPSKGGYPTPRKRRPQITRAVKELDHKNIPVLKKYINQFGQIESRRRSGNAPMTQRMIATAIKRARHLALLPFVKN